MINMKSWAFSINSHEVPSIKLMLFFEGLIEGLKMYEDERAACLANESRKLARNALFMVLSNLSYRHPNLDLNDGFRKATPGADVPAAEEKAAPLTDKVLKVPTAPRSRQARH